MNSLLPTDLVSCNTPKDIRQSKKKFSHFTCPSVVYFPDFGRLNMKSKKHEIDDEKPVLNGKIHYLMKKLILNFTQETNIAQIAK